MAKKNNLEKLLVTQDKDQIVARGPGGVLSRLFHTMLIDLNINPSRWMSFMFDYINDPRNRVPKDREKQASRRGNLIKALADDKMSWKVICKGFRLLQFKRVEIVLIAHHRHGGKVTKHSVAMDLDHPQSEDDFGDDTETNIELKDAQTKTEELHEPKSIPIQSPLIGEDK